MAGEIQPGLREIVDDYATRMFTGADPEFQPLVDAAHSAYMQEQPEGSQLARNSAVMPLVWLALRSAGDWLQTEEGSKKLHPERTIRYDGIARAVELASNEASRAGYYDRFKIGLYSAAGIQFDEKMEKDPNVENRVTTLAKPAVMDVSELAVGAYHALKHIEGIDVVAGVQRSVGLLRFASLTTTRLPREMQAKIIGLVAERDAYKVINADDPGAIAVGFSDEVQQFFENHRNAYPGGGCPARKLKSDRYNFVRETWQLLVPIIVGPHPSYGREAERSTRTENS